MANDTILYDRQTLDQLLALARRAGSRHPRRLATTEAMLLVHRAFFNAVKVARRLDDVLYPDWRDVEVDAPVFIVAPPRSGTTFLQRLMCLDDRFAYLKLYHTILPAVSLYRLIDSAADLDPHLGGVLGRGVEAIESTFFSGWEDIHPLGFNRAEEDEGLFVLTLLSPGVYLLAPEVAALPRPAFVDDLEPSTRQKMQNYYKSSLQKVMYHEGPEKRFLGKTVLLPGRMNTVLGAFPDARFIQLVRHPYKTVPSFVSMFSKPWASHSPEIPKDSPQTHQLADLAITYYRRLFDARERFGDSAMITIRFPELVGQPRRSVERIYEWLDTPMEPAFEQRLDRELAARRDYSSSHSYSLEEYGLTKGEIYGRLRDVFEFFDFDA